MSTLKTHVSLNVTNLEKSVAFYRALFGIEPVKRKADYAKFDVGSPPLNLALNAVPLVWGRRLGRLSHLGIQVPSTEDVLAAEKRFEQAGLKPWGEMGATCCYALQDKVWVKDPDGNKWEIFVVHVSDVTAGVDSKSCCATGAQSTA